MGKRAETDALQVYSEAGQAEWQVRVAFGLDKAQHP